MDMYSKLEAIEIVNDLVDMRSAFFDAARAQRLIELVPVDRKFRIISISMKSRESTKNVQGETKEDFSYNQSPVWHVGKYKIEHRPGSLNITHISADDFRDREKNRWCLTYNKTSKEPTALKTLQKCEFVFPLIHRKFCFLRLQPVKTPAIGMTPS